MYRSHTSWLDARRRTAVTERDFRKRDEQKPGSSSMWFPSSSQASTSPRGDLALATPPRATLERPGPRARRRLSRNYKRGLCAGRQRPPYRERAGARARSLGALLVARTRAGSGPLMTSSCSLVCPQCRARNEASLRLKPPCSREIAGLRRRRSQRRAGRRRVGPCPWRMGGLGDSAGRGPALVFSQVPRCFSHPARRWRRISKDGASTGSCFRGEQGGRLLPHDARSAEVADGCGNGDKQSGRGFWVGPCIRAGTGLGWSVRMAPPV